MKKVSAGEAWLEATCLGSEQEHVLIEHRLEEVVEHTVAIRATGKDSYNWKEYLLKKACLPFSFVPDSLEAESVHTLKVMTKLKGKGRKKTSGAKKQSSPRPSSQSSVCLRSVLRQ